MPSTRSLRDPFQIPIKCMHNCTCCMYKPNAHTQITFFDACDWCRIAQTSDGLVPINTTARRAAVRRLSHRWREPTNRRKMYRQSSFCLVHCQQASAVGHIRCRAHCQPYGCSPWWRVPSLRASDQKRSEAIISNQKTIISDQEQSEGDQKGSEADS